MIRRTPVNSMLKPFHPFNMPRRQMKLVNWFVKLIDKLVYISNSPPFTKEEILQRKVYHPTTTEGTITIESKRMQLFVVNCLIFVPLMPYYVWIE